MAEELSSLVLQGRHHATISPEGLELMGKKAANLFLNDGVALNEGVAKLAGEHPDINTEQVKRVCEFANTATYLALHDQNKTAGAKSSYPQFQLADPGRVIQDLSDGARPTLITPVDVDYGRQPEKMKVSAAHSAKADRALEQLFNVKEAQVDLDFTRETAYLEVIAARDMLQGLEDNLKGAAQQFDSMFKEASDAWYEGTKRHVLEGGSFVDILNAARATQCGDEKIAELLTEPITNLIRDGVSTHEKVAAQTRELEKTGHRLVDLNHPLVRTFKAMVDLDEEISKTAAALEDVQGQQVKVRAFIRENFGAHQAR